MSLLNHFCENNSWLLTVKYFHNKALLRMFNRVLKHASTTENESTVI